MGDCGPSLLYPTASLAQTNAANRPTSPTTKGAGRRKTRGRGLVLRRKAVVTPTAGRPPGCAWLGDVAGVFALPVLSLPKESHARFGSNSGVGDCPADHNLGRAPLDLTSPLILHASGEQVAVRGFERTDRTMRLLAASLSKGFKATTTLSFVLIRRLGPV